MQSDRSECLSIFATLAMVVGVNSAARVACFSNSVRLTGHWACRCLHASIASARFPDRDEEARALPGGVAPSETTTTSPPACSNCNISGSMPNTKAVTFPLITNSTATAPRDADLSRHAGMLACWHMPIVDNGAHATVEVGPLRRDRLQPRRESCCSHRIASGSLLELCVVCDQAQQQRRTPPSIWKPLSEVPNHV